MGGSGQLGEQLAEQPHHDGSEAFLPDPPHRVGQDFAVFLRVPHQAPVSRVVVRQVHDGEPFPVSARIDRRTASATWWRADLRQHNPVVNYRFLTDGGPLGYRWIRPVGVADFDPNDAGDYRSSIHPAGPDWLSDAVAYQIFPDRFAKSGRVRAPMPEWAIPASWDDKPIWGRRGTAQHFFGGDLFGVAEHLAYIASLGANLLYLTPVFPAASNHRYNASSFDQVDPLLGGDAAYAELIEAAHRRGMRVIGDFTTNHTGAGHDWFRAAQSDPNSAEAGFYYFNEHPHDYVGWFGVPTLPKVDHGSAALRDRMISGPDSPLRRYLRPPFNLDGWRIDVANMTGRQGAADHNQAVARLVRSVVEEERPDGYLVGEHFHDFRDDLPGDGWQGVMNYAGFTKPLWSWLANPALPMDNWMGLPWQGWPRLPGSAVVTAIRQFAAVPWQHLLASMVLISSHDSPRIATVTQDPALVEVAAGAMLAFPGVPMIWAGDEIGLAGQTGEDGRRAFPWHRPDCWHRPTLEAFRRLGRVRAHSSALRTGGLRWVFVDDDRIAFVRDAPSESVLVLLSRAPGADISLPSRAIGLQSSAESDSLYAETSISVDGDRMVLPGDGPAVHIWRLPHGRTVW